MTIPQPVTVGTGGRGLAGSTPWRAHMACSGVSFFIGVLLVPPGRSRQRGRVEFSGQYPGTKLVVNPGICTATLAGALCDQQVGPAGNVNERPAAQAGVNSPTSILNSV